MCSIYGKVHTSAERDAKLNFKASENSETGILTTPPRRPHDTVRLNFGELRNSNDMETHLSRASSDEQVTAQPEHASVDEVEEVQPKRPGRQLFIQHRKYVTYFFAYTSLVLATWAPLAEFISMTLSLSIMKTGWLRIVFTVVLLLNAFNVGVLAYLLGSPVLGGGTDGSISERDGKTRVQVFHAILAGGICASWIVIWMQDWLKSSG